MRVIAGKARRIQLDCIEGMSTRPTTDRIKETLFNMISADLYDCHFLDLFAGSGAIGIEAISRGAKQAVFVENNRTAVKCIEGNLKKTRLESQASVMAVDCMTAIHQLDHSGRYFDFVFMDPPYNHLWEKQILELLRNVDFIDEDTVIIIEASLETEADYLDSLGFTLVKEKKYKTNKHLFVRRELN